MHCPKGQACEAADARDGGNSDEATIDVEGGPAGTSSFKLDSESAILLGVLPFINECAYSYVYTAVPLHFVDQNWPIWQLSVIFSLCYLPRMIASDLTARVGDWVVVVTSGICAIASVWMAVSPNNLVAVWVGVIATSAAVSVTTFRSLVYRSYNAGWDQQRALRWFTLFDTTGYGFGPFVGGVLYDFGGMSACGWFQLLSAVLCCGMSLSLEKIRRAFWDSVAPKSSVCEEDHAEVDTGEKLAFGPVAMILFATGANNLVYCTEWCLYAIYFSQVYGWTGSLIGATQMAGDLLGSLILAASALQCVSQLGAHFTVPTPVRVLLGAPLNIAFLLGCHGALLVMLAQSHFGIALAGQIGMGTAYVFNEQFVHELLLTYSFGSHATYKRLVVYQYAMFCAGCASSSLIGINMYRAVGFATTFYSGAGFAMLASTLFGMYFALRLAGTQSGLAGGLAEAEAEIRAVGAEQQKSMEKAIELHIVNAAVCFTSGPDQS